MSEVQNGGVGGFDGVRGGDWDDPRRIRRVTQMSFFHDVPFLQGRRILDEGSIRWRKFQVQSESTTTVTLVNLTEPHRKGTDLERTCVHGTRGVCDELIFTNDQCDGDMAGLS